MVLSFNNIVAIETWMGKQI